MPSGDLSLRAARGGDVGAGQIDGDHTNTGVSRGERNPARLPVEGFTHSAASQASKSGASAAMKPGQPRRLVLKPNPKVVRTSGL